MKLRVLSLFAGIGGFDLGLERTGGFETVAGAPPMLNGWFVWDRQWKGETVLRMLDRKDARQSEMFGDAA